MKERRRWLGRKKDKGVNVSIYITTNIRKLVIFFI